MNRRLLYVILLSLSFVVMVIGAHRSIVEDDFAGNYWIFMIGLVLFILYNYTKKKDSGA
ncbi:hypothetical protein [Pontibacter chinhatensis]|uniref:Uncharacterized protein n=1 Tax=Pontibacter chinhatensis TaxID=1436961 RepID=A0A1I2TMG0_9BACT|nr:hypothetical protein [Pontibacter chinhatensis]SFG66094.1 hypothetical protein SAMN05421739_103200 [Pontibacter chinhatensis]